MSSDSLTQPRADHSRPQNPGGGARDYALDYIRRVRGGEMGSIPGIIGLVVLAIFFSILKGGFLDAYNVENMVVYGAPTIVMAMGLIFVLLLGEIDLSAGTAGGVCAVLAAVEMVRHQMNWVLAVLLAALLGAIIGMIIGWLRARVGIPSFVITLAAFLSFQGVTIIMVGNSGSILLPDSQKTLLALTSASTNDYMPIWAGWAMLAIVVVGYAAVKLRGVSKRMAENLAVEPYSIAMAKVAALAVLGAGFIYYMGYNRIVGVARSSFYGTLTSEGVPWIVPVVLVLLFGGTYLLNRTRYGRHVFAVGGNEEAARRAGIRVNAIRTSVFVICSFMAALSGLISLSVSAGVANNAGGGNTLLLAVGAAVIGGTSLFGGRGRIIDAVVGGLVVEIISWGMGDLITGTNAPGWQEVVTGLVLLLAAGFDAISRKAGSTQG
ncbi:ABC transporter permease [Actinospica durhamensis]|uniref:Xylose transport system permease protein XylH n=1 Tax=Actinospica durhamensis TaxID=1508375 RepID=A0A941EL92_9ACTN|nr:ABC transporter permease [Actinospica durhamensis]MBR7833211.1 ABC transporter permease [Actinospica durhamensis]